MQYNTHDLSPDQEILVKYVQKYWNIGKNQEVFNILSSDPKSGEVPLKKVDKL